MSQITNTREQAIFHADKWLGLNESPDGDTTLKDGELSVCRNFKITREGHLQIRSGTKTICDLHTPWRQSATEGKAKQPEVCGLWYGKVGRSHHLLASYGGLIFDVDGAAAKEIGQCTQDDTHFFGFSDKVYLLNGHEYMVWDGGAESRFAPVTGYIPVITTATPPSGGGTLLEPVNRLNGLRRQKFSPDGTARLFQLNEMGIDSVLSVSGTDITYTVNQEKGQVSFASAPEKGINTVEITYQKGGGARGEVTSMRFSELYNGNTDARVFLYGDGSNRTIYSGLTADGAPSAEYFPDLYELRAGSENTSITSCVRHYSRLLIFKEDSTWSVSYSTLELASGQTTPAFYVTTVNRQIGNIAPGQACLVENNPVTLDGDTAYEWKATSTSGAITDSDRNAVRMSDRVRSTLRTYRLAGVRIFNHKELQELYFTYGDKALLYNYANNTWYQYTNFPAARMVNVEGSAFFLTPAGALRSLAPEYRNDDGAEIDAYAETGSMSFQKEWMEKCVACFYVSLKPESGALVTITAQTNRRSDYEEKVVASSLSTFSRVNFAHWSFGTNRKPQVRRIKLKLKRAAFLKIIFKSTSASAAATILSLAAKVRYTDNVR